MEEVSFVAQDFAMGKVSLPSDWDISMTAQFVGPPDKAMPADVPAAKRLKPNITLSVIAYDKKSTLESLRESQIEQLRSALPGFRLADSGVFKHAVTGADILYVAYTFQPDPKFLIKQIQAITLHGDASLLHFTATAPSATFAQHWGYMEKIIASFQLGGR
jgi:hypothetical protein